MCVTKMSDVHAALRVQWRAGLLTECGVEADEQRTFKVPCRDIKAGEKLHDVSTRLMWCGSCSSAGQARGWLSFYRARNGSPGLRAVFVTAGRPWAACLPLSVTRPAGAGRALAARVPRPATGPGQDAMQHAVRGNQVQNVVRRYVLW